MEIFGVGPMELILVLIVALLVFGPDKLPEVGARLGKGMRGMRQATRDFSREIAETREILEAPVREISQPLQDVAAAARVVRQPQAALREAVLGEINRGEELPGEPSAPAHASELGENAGGIAALEE